MRELLAGMKTERALHPPADRAADRHHADRRRPLCRDDRVRPDAQIGPEIMNVSVMGGFAYADTAKNGLTRRRHRARATTAPAARRWRWRARSREFGWAQRRAVLSALTALDEAVAKALAVGARPGAAGAAVFADVADNPGGGGRGNTMFLLRRFPEAGVKGALVGVIHDPPLAAEAHRHGLHYHFDAAFNRDGDDEFSEPWTRAGAGRGADRRQLRRPARHLCRAAARARPLRGAGDRRHHGRRGLAPRAMRRPGLLRDVRARHRQGARSSWSSRAAISAAASTSSSRRSRSSRSTCPASPRRCSTASTGSACRARCPARRGRRVDGAVA